MANKRADINQADLLRVLEYFASVGESVANEKKLAMILKSLGLTSCERQDVRQYATKQGAWEHKRSAAKTTSQLPEPPKQQKKIGSPNRLSNAFPHERELSFTLNKLPGTHIGDVDTDTFYQYEAASPIAVTKKPDVTPLPRASLFPEKTYRNIVSALIAQPALGFEIDINKLIEEASMQRFLQTVPMKPRWSTQVQCQLLLDFNQVLVPLWDDLRILIQQVQSVTGENACQVFEFDSDPNKALRWDENGEEHSWVADKSKFVIVATDFGQLNQLNYSTGIGHKGWLSFYQQCKGAGVEIIFLTPLEKQDFPTSLANHLPIVHWGKSIRASEVKHLKAGGQSCLG